MKTFNKLLLAFFLIFGGITLNSGIALGITVSISGTNVSCNGLADGTALANISGSSGTVSYVWSTSATTTSVTGLAAGTYFVTVSDTIGSDIDSIIITEPLSLTAATSVTGPISCNGGTNGSVSANGSGGTPGYSYLWSNGITTAANGGLSAGTYSVTVTDANGCTATSSATLGEPTALVPAISASNVSCSGGTDGSATASASGGTPGYTFLWSNGANTATTSALAAGTYTVTVTDNNGCTDTNTVAITEPTAIVATISSSSNVSCNGLADGGATATATGGTPAYTYSWSNGATLAVVSGLAAGTYSVTITDTNGCTDSTSVVISEPAPLTVAVAVDSNASCNGQLDGGVTASAIGGTSAYTYAWSNTATTASVTSIAAGTYTVTVTDANGCTATDSATITEPSAVVAAIVVDSNASCNGFANGGATASASGGAGTYTYTWSNAATTASITGIAAGTYTVTITDANGCTGTNTATITEPAALVATAIAGDISCNGLTDGTATASATGGTAAYSYLWSNSGTTAVQTALAAGTYTVTITDTNGCTDIDSAIVSEPATLSIAVGTTTNVSCNGSSTGSATTITTGGTLSYTYSWSNSATTDSITGVAAGTYSVTVTDASGCSANTSLTVTEPTALVATAVVDSNVTCNGASNGGATSSATGGTSPYSYSWSNSATTASISGVTAGTYTIIITDANGCTATSSSTITEPTALVVTLVTQTNSLCNGDNTGSATSLATGGTAPYTYLWSNSATTAAITGIAAGSYTVTATDANGCTDSISVVITEPTALTLSSAFSNVSCNGVLDGSIDLTVSGGTTPYGYLWSNTATTEDLSSIAAGIYTVIVTDANGCLATETIVVSEPAPLTVTTTVVDANCEGGNDGSITANVTGGTTGYTYLWNDPANQTTISASNLEEGPYSVDVTDANGCVATGTGTVGFSNANPVLDFGADTITGCTDTSVVLEGPDGFTYLWSTGATTQSITVTTSGIVSLVITAPSSCSGTDSIEMIFNGPCVGIGELFDNVTVDYYPNPTNGLVNLEVIGLEGKDLEIAVINIFGQVILNNTVSNIGTQFQRQLDLSTQAQGIYFVRLTADGQSKMDRIVVK